jgi:cytochrome c oxidase subunit II
MWDFPFFPESASTVAPRVDAIFYVLTILSLAFSLLVAGLIVFFAIRYRESQKVNRTKLVTENFTIEFSWAFIPFLLAMGIFGWATYVYVEIQQAPADALEIYVLGKQWMWHAQHPSGKREIDQLHVPVNQPVKLIMISEDVIHSFYIPAFRVKQDVLPGRYTTLWFEATQTGEYHLFCAEYCGTEHSFMIGSVIVLEQLEYQRWLSGGESSEPLAAAGARLFEQRGCISCHTGGEGARGPSLAGLFGQEVLLEGGGTAVADEAYLRESILDPHAKLVSGYGPIMPTYEGSISEEGILQLVAYIKSLSESAGEGRETTTDQ